MIVIVLVIDLPADEDHDYEYDQDYEDFLRENRTIWELAVQSPQSGKIRVPIATNPLAEGSG